MTLTYHQLMSWSASGIETAGEEVDSQIRRHFLNQQDEIDNGRVPGTWVGAAAERARSRFGKVRDGLNDLAANISPVVEACQTAAGDIRNAQRSAQDAYEAIGKKQLNGHRWKVISASTDGVHTESPALKIGDGDDADATQDEVDQVQREVNDLVADLGAALAKGERADNDLANVLNSAAGEQYEGGSGTISSAGLPPELRGLSATDIAHRMMDDPARYRGYTSDLTPYQQSVLGREIGKEGDEIRNATDQVPMGDLQKFNSLLSTFGTAPAVATGFLNQVGPKGLLELDAKGAAFGGEHSIDDSDADERDKAAANFQRVLGATLAAGTQDIGDDDGGSLTHVSTDWKWDLLDAGGDKISLGTFDVRGFQVLSPLLADGSKFDPAFLQSAATSTVDYERNWDWDKHPEGPWRPSPGVLGEKVRLDFTQGTDRHDDPLGHDPIPGVLRSLGDNPEAARGFFSSEETIEPGKAPYDTMVKYLMYDRADEHHIMNDFADNHALDHPPLGPLGTAMEAATLGDGADERSVGVVNSMVDLANDRLEHSGGKLSETDMVPPELRRDLGNITSHYMGSFHHELDPAVNQYDADTTAGYIGDDARFGGDHPDQAARAWLADLAKDPSAAREMRGASNLWMTEQATRGLHGIHDPGELHDDINRAVQANQAALGAIDLGATDQVRTDQVGADDAYNKKVDFGADAVGTILGETPVGKNPIGGFLLDQALDGVKDGLHHDHTADSNLQAGQIFSSSSQTTENLVRDSYWHNLPDDAYPPGLDRSTNLDHLNPAQQQTYSNWLEHNPWGKRIGAEVDDIHNSYETHLQEAKDKVERW